MKQLIEDIIVIIYKLKDVYKEILLLSKKKQSHIIKSDSQAVSEVVREEWELLNAATQLEEQRLEIVSKLAELCKADINDLSLAEIGRRAQKEQRLKLEAAGNELKDIVTAQKQMNAQNKDLLRLHFEYMDFMVNNFLKDAQLSNIYGNSGNVEEARTSNTGIIDSHV